MEGLPRKGKTATTLEILEKEAPALYKRYADIQMDNFQKWYATNFPDGQGIPPQLRLPDKKLTSKGKELK
jgi:hypothetical protein